MPSSAAGTWSPPSRYRCQVTEPSGRVLVTSRSEVLNIDASAPAGPLIVIWRVAGSWCVTVRAVPGPPSTCATSAWSAGSDP